MEFHSHSGLRFLFEEGFKFCVDIRHKDGKNHRINRMINNLLLVI